MTSLSSRKALVLLRDLIAERTGNYYGDHRLPILGDKIAGRAAELGFLTLLDYYYLLRYDPLQVEEWPVLESLITVKETYFWREAEAFRAVVESILPHIKSPVRIWHAGCAQGEEPLSLLMALDEAGLKPRDFDILATDLDRRALEKARLGRYTERAVQRLPPDKLERYFRLLPDGEYQVDSALLARVRFRPLNLVDEDHLRELAPFDIIFCRNVMIYFSEALVTQVARHLYRLLKVPGFLFVGTTESLLSCRVPFVFSDLSGAIAYCKEVSGE